MQHLAWAAIHEVLDMLDLTTRQLGEVGALREELPQQLVRVLVGAALPGTLRMREVDLDARRLGEEPMLGHLLAPVVGQRAAHLLRQRAHLAGEGPADAGRVLRLQGHQQRGAGRALDEGPEGRSRPAPHEQVAFPMAGNRPIGHRRGTLLDADHVWQLPSPVVAPSVSVRPAALMALPQGAQELFAQRTPGQDVEIGVDRFMRDPHRGIVRIRRRQPSGNLLRRPALRQARIYVGPQPGVHHEHPLSAALTPQPDGHLLRRERSVLVPPIAQAHPSRAAQFPRDRARRASQPSGHRSDTGVCRQASADLLAFGNRQSRVPWHRAQLLSPEKTQDTRVALAT